MNRGAASFPHDGAFPLEESASDQRVRAISLSSRWRALSIAYFKPFGLTLNVVIADGSRTRVALRMLSTSLQPIRTGRHDCIAVRGVKCHEARMTTVALRGLFREKPTLVEEFHQALTKIER